MRNFINPWESQNPWQQGGEYHNLALDVPTVGDSYSDYQRGFQFKFDESGRYVGRASYEGESYVAIVDKNHRELSKIALNDPNMYKEILGKQRDSIFDIQVFRTWTKQEVDIFTKPTIDFLKAKFETLVQQDLANAPLDPNGLPIYASGMTILSLIAVESMGRGKLDWGSKVYELSKSGLRNRLNILPINNNLMGYDNLDFGNFLWGYALAKLSFPLALVSFGAEINGFLFSKRQNSTGFGVEWQGDTDADQKAIKEGYAYAQII